VVADVLKENRFEIDHKKGFWNTKIRFLSSQRTKKVENCPYLVEEGTIFYYEHTLPL